MKNQVLTLSAVLTILLFAACNKASIDDDLPFNPDLFGTVDYSYAIDDTILDYMQANEIPGIALGVIRNGKIDYTRGYGYLELTDSTAVTEDSKFFLAQVAHTITTTALLQLYEDGMIGLDSNINNYLNFDQPIINGNFPGTAITPRMLLSHSSGIMDNPAVLAPLITQGDSDVSLEEFVEGYFLTTGAYFSINNFSAASTPGTGYEFSNAGISLAGYLVESVSGISFDQYCKLYVFPKLGIFETSWFLADLNLSEVADPYTLAGGPPVMVEHYGYPWYPGGQLRTSVEHLTRFFYAAVDNGGIYQNERILNDTTAAQAQTVPFPAANPAQAHGWQYMTFNGRDLIGMTGTDVGVSNRMYYDTLTGVGVVLLSNGDNNEAVMDTIMERVFSVSE